MNEEKKVPFKWEYGEETISLQLGMYANNQRLYIGMIILKARTPRNIDMVWNMVRPAGEPVRILHLTLILYFRTM